jgi:hypothetical protein
VGSLKIGGSLGWQKMIPYLQNIQRVSVARPYHFSHASNPYSGSSGRTRALQPCKPELKPQSHLSPQNGSTILKKIFLCVCDTGIWTPLLQGRRSTIWATPPVHSAVVILEMWCLVAWGGLKSQSSGSQPPEQWGLQAWATSTWLAQLFSKGLFNF